MPTVILLDTSLSMIRSVSLGENGETTTMLQQAIQSINQFLDYLAAHEKLEFVALITFSSLFEVPLNFTRDFDYVRSKLAKIEEGDEAHIDVGLVGAAKLVLAEWGPSVQCNVVIFTDGTPVDFEIQPPPYAFNRKFHIFSVSTPSSSALGYFHRIAEMSTDSPGCVVTPEPGPITPRTTSMMVKKLAETIYSTYAGVLKCGNLTARVGLYPAPQPHTTITPAETTTRVFAETLEVCGFIDFANLASPMAVSRHLVTPLPVAKTEVKPKTEAAEGEDETDDGKLPSFCVLFHGALKVENVAALCTVGEDWFGVLYSWADSKKKSNLMLTVFEPGTDAVPWLGNFNYLGALEECQPLSTPEVPSFPVCPVEKRSYSQNTVVWIRKAGLQSDIQKILRQARKLPEKTQQFYKELNRLRKAAVCFGFVELLNGLAEILDRECSNLPSGTHPDSAMQLQHAAEMLRRPISRDPKCVISPLKTRFQTEND